MKLLPCPINGLRPIEEFAFGGEVRDMPNPQQSADAEWGNYIFNRNGAPGLKREWWYHVPSGTWFIAERHTATDQVECTYLWEEA